MPIAYSPAEWSDFFVAAAGACAALAGLVFVGISINLTRILAIPGLSTRAGGTIAVLANALAISLVALSPGLTSDALGVTILVIAALAMCGVLVGAWRSPGPDARRHRVNEVVLDLLATVPFVIAGLSLVAGAGGGLRWALAGVVLSLLVGLGNGWVLLVEILR